MSYTPSEAILANTTRLPVPDAVKFNMADRVHRLSLAASNEGEHGGNAITPDEK